MPAHLARHMNTIHGRGGGKTGGGPGRKAKRRGRPKGARRAGGASAAGGGPARLIGDMRMYHDDLVTQRAGLESQIQNLEAAMDALGGTGSAGRMAPRKRRGRPPGRRAKRRGRPPGSRTGARIGRPPGSKTVKRRGRPPGGGRKGSLRDMIQQVLRQSSRPMSPTEISNAVVGAGYSTKAKDLTKAVSNTLPDLPVKRVGFGQYRM